MNIVAVGVNHKISSIEIREKFYLSTVEQELLLSELNNDPAVSEAIVLSTCNRTEIYASIIENDPEILLKTLFRVKKLPMEINLQMHFYTYSDRDAVKHLFRVASGLDSLILGEKQVLGQVKAATELSRQHGTLSRNFNILSNMAIRAGKKARNETDIDCGGSSVSWAAVNMAQKKLTTLENKSVLIIGAGKMGELAANQLNNKNIGHIYVMNRTQEKAVTLAQKFNGTAVSFLEIKDIIKTVDVCICSAGAPHYLIEKELMEKVMTERNNKEILLIDISMPRNIDPKVTEVENVSLLEIDDLDKIVEDNLKRRHEAIAQVEEIVKQKTFEFYDKLSKNMMFEDSALFEPAGIEDF